MITLVQGVGLVIALTLTVMLLMLGYQLLQILQELKKSVEKINFILDDAHRVSDSVAEPVVAFSGFLQGIRSGSQLLQILASFKNAKRSSQREED